METIALDKLISGYKKAKAIYVRTFKIVDKEKRMSKQAKAIFLMRDKIRAFRQDFKKAVESGKRRRVGFEENSKAIQIESAPTYVERKIKQKIRDQKRLDKIVYGNRTQIKKSVTNRLDHLQAISKKREDILKQYRRKQVEIEKKRQKESFLSKQRDRAEKLQLDRQRAKEERQWMLQERRLRQKQAAMLKKEKARLAEERKQKNVLNEKARIEKRQAHLLSLANAEKAVVDPKFSTSNIDDNKHHVKANFNHAQLLKFGENIANQRKALGVHNDPRMNNAQRYGFSDTSNTDSSENIKHELFVDEEYSIGSVAEENVNEANQEVQQPHVQPSYRETFISKQDEKSERQYRTQVDQAQSNTDLQNENTIVEGTINDGEEEKNQIDVDLEEKKA